MISLSDNSPPQETAAAYGLFAILADPVLSKQRLDALVAEKTAAIEASNNARADLAEAAKHAETTKAALQEIDTNRQEIEGRLAIRARNIEARETAAVQKQDELASLEKSLVIRETELSKTIAAHQGDMTNREIAVAAREKAAEALHESAQSMKADYEQKVATLRVALK